MSKLADLLKGHTVTIQTLDKVANIKKGKQLNKMELHAGGKYPAYNGGATPSGYTDLTNVEARSILVSQGGASAGFVNYVETRSYANAHCYYLEVDETKAITKYVYYSLKNQELKIMSRQQGAGIPALNRSALATLDVVLPSIEVQEEIVRILDKFTTLQAELTAELTGRGQQYGHYRDSIFEALSGNGEVTRMSKLTELLKGHQVERGILSTYVEVRTGAAVSKASIATNPGEYPVINSGLQPLGYIATYNTENDPIGITSRGAGVGTVLWTPGRYYRGNLNYSTTVKDSTKLNQRYLYYYLKSVQYELDNLCTQVGIPALNKSALDGLELLVPPLDVQEEVVTILNKFEVYSSSATQGLQKEIELRKKQYEYYRDYIFNLVADQATQV